MTSPIRDALGRPAIELVGVTGGTSTTPTVGSGVCVLGAEWGSGTDAATVIDGEYADLAPVPFELDMERWQLFAYDTAGAPLAISAVVDVQATDYATNSFASIAGSDLPTLASAAKNQSLAMAGWTLNNLTDTAYRFVLVSHTGSPGKIVLGVRAFAP